VIPLGYSGGTLLDFKYPYKRKVKVNGRNTERKAVWRHQKRLKWWGHKYTSAKAATKIWKKQETNSHIEPPEDLSSAEFQASNFQNCERMNFHYFFMLICAIYYTNLTKLIWTSVLEIIFIKTSSHFHNILSRNISV
jgi:hypothetical protein